MPNGHLLNFVNAKRLCLFCLMRQKHCWNYFAFNQSYLVKGKIAPVIFCLTRQNKNTRFYIGGSGLDRTGDFQKFCHQDCIRFNFIGSELESDGKISQSAHLCSLDQSCCWLRLAKSWPEAADGAVFNLCQKLGFSAMSLAADMLTSQSRALKIRIRVNNAKNIWDKKMADLAGAQGQET